MKTIVTIVGARPQFIKVAPVSRAIRNVPDLKELLVHTGQHFDANMSDVFFDELEIPKPDYTLDINGGGHGAMTGSMMQRLEPLLQDIKPDTVLIYGDTNSTLAGALTAAKLHIPVAHVEAGLRSFNRAMPEEINRVVADHLSDLLFASTAAATTNLLHEGVDGAKILEVGDVMYDAALMFARRAEQHNGLLVRLAVVPKGFVLATIHRAENTDDPVRLTAIISALEAVAAQLPVILPLHPRTRNAMAKLGLAFNRVKTLEPLGYLDMVALESQAAVIATDSGGVQKEAFFYGVPCVTLRTETEWSELVDLGWNRLVSPDSGDIAQRVLEAVGTKGQESYPYGNGDAAPAIAAALAG
ncbi:MAG TPA: UDP-N-acetylglucosamine 2-epimerase (non-hydrolyzing) [Devosiaceae bacterium]|jgi:UDP-GlcNAc3NAcA epimerase